MNRANREHLFAICVENKDCEDLGIRKVYKVVPDARAEEENYIRVIDDSGEDYLYPASYFVPVKLPRKAEEALKLSS